MSESNPKANAGQRDEAIQDSNTDQQANHSHPLATGLGAVGGGAAGGALGRSVSGNVGAAIGGVAGAIAGGMAGNAIAGFTEDLLQVTQPTLSLGLGADTQPVDLPLHYTWDELRALSKPQLGESNHA
jgi:hypothetical protein